MLGQGLEPHVINEQQVGLQIPPQGSVLVVDGFILQEVPHQIENRGVQHGEAESDSGLSDGLSQVGLADARGAQKEDVGVFSKEASGGQLEDHFAGNSGVKAPVEVLQAFWVPEGSRLVRGPARSAQVAWVKNGLRHSFCSYRLAQTSDAAKVALEAGNSPTMIFRHYRELVTPDQAQEWFSIRPSTVGV